MRAINGSDIISSAPVDFYNAPFLSELINAEKQTETVKWPKENTNKSIFKSKSKLFKINKRPKDDDSDDDIEESNIAYDSVSTSEISRLSPAPSLSELTDTEIANETETETKSVQNQYHKPLRDLPIKEFFNIIQHETELNSWNKIAAMIDYTYPSQNKLKIASLDDDHQQTKELKYCVKHAAYAYFMDFIGDPVHLKIIQKDLSLDGVRPLKVYKPGYFLAVDEKNEYILLCIRGTINIGDTLTDLDAHITPKHFGHKDEDITKYNCHHGMYDAALSLYDHTTFKMQELLQKEEYADYKILMTGHSLGAGVCSLLGLLWNTKKTFPVSKFSCYSFASPLIIGQKGMEHSQLYGNMISVAVSTDIVTRLSIGGLLNMYGRINEIKKDAEKNRNLIESIIKKRVLSDDTNQFKDGLDIDEKDLLERLKNVDIKNDIRDDLKLYPCGKVLWFVPEFVVCDDIKQSKRYQKLLNMVEWQDNSSYLVHFMQLIYKIIRDFYVVNSNEVLVSIKENDRWIFTEMVSNGIESFDAHLPGRYLNGFDIDLLDIFAMSKIHKFIHYSRLPMIFIRSIMAIIMASIYFIKIIYGLLFW